MYPYVYDSNCTAYQYIENYKDYLEGLGLEVKEARLMKVEEAFDLGCVETSRVHDCKNAPEFVRETSYWLGSIGNVTRPWYITITYAFVCNNEYCAETVGIRPIIVI